MTIVKLVEASRRGRQRREKVRNVRKKGGKMMNMPTRSTKSMSKIWLAGLIGTAPLISGEVFAQTSDTTEPPAASENEQVDELVVTAQRREERLIDVPVAVSAVGGAQIKTLGITQASQLKNVVPSLEVVDAGPVPKIGIRGIALNDFSENNESPVAVYTNDVYIGSVIASLSQLFDISRVEVLRGPQGTLFGRNATGGLIQIVTNGPTRDFSGGASLQYGSFNQVIVEAHQNLPLSDSVRTRSAMIYNSDDGFQKNLITGTRLGTTNLFHVRESIDIDLSASLTNRIVAHYGEQDDLASLPAFRGTRNPTTNAACPADQIVANLCVTSEGRRNADPDPRYVYSALARPTSNITNYGVSNTLIYSLDGINLTSVTAYESTKTNRLSDAGPTGTNLYFINYRSKRKQISQELRADGKTDNLTWVAGLYYYRERMPDGYVGAFNLIPLLGTTLGYQNYYDQTTRSASAFGQIDYNILPGLTVTGGLRYSDEKKELTITDDLAHPHFTDNYVAKNSELTWKAGLSWHLSPQMMAYANVTTGFKSPAFNASLVVANQAVPSQPETNTNYEIGFKGQTADRRVQVSLAAFYTDYKNFQLIATPITATPGMIAVSQLINVQQADIYGVEADVSVRPFGGLSLSANFTYLNTKINAPGVIVSGTPIDGQMLTLSPEYSARGVARYDLVTEIGTISPWANVSYRSHTYGKLPTILLNELYGYTLVDAGISWTSPDKKWKAEFLVQNATDREYYTNSNTFSGLSQLSLVKFGKQRTFAGRISVNW